VAQTLLSVLVRLGTSGKMNLFLPRPLSRRRRDAADEDAGEPALSAAERTPKDPGKGFTRNPRHNVNQAYDLRPRERVVLSSRAARSTHEADALHAMGRCEIARN
jgi:hypothetical protein